MVDDPTERAHATPLAGPSRSALAARERASAAVVHTSTTCERMLAPTTERLARIHRQQIDRDPWPDFDAFERGRYDEALLRDAARHWARRATAEHGSIHQFSGLLHALCEARVGLQLLGPLARLITDEVRHAELCARMALACDPEGPTQSPRAFGWPLPRAPWPAPPDEGTPAAIMTWAASAILIACCLGETLSRPMYESLIVVCTDPIAESVLRQIQRDEHLHAAFGWDAVATLLPAIGDEGRARLQEALRRAFGGFEATTACGRSVESIAGRELTIARGDAPNLGILGPDQYAMIFFATIEHEIFPALTALGLDPAAAWAGRPKVTIDE
ncbi:MAG: hypothetical protein R3B09_00475 [Nannocystaceae bacterium]